MNGSWSRIRLHRTNSRPFLIESLEARRLLTGGLISSGDQRFHQDIDGIDGIAQLIDQFGAAVATGDFDGNGFADLAVGVPTESINGNFAAGAVNVIYGSSQGLTTVGDQFWSQDTDGIKGEAQPEDSFGAALAVGDFNQDGADDLAIGVPDESIDGIPDAGAVHVILGSLGEGLVSPGDQFWHQNVEGVKGEAQIDDEFGAALAVGDFNNDSFPDLAIGVPGESVDGIPGAGAVNVLYGSAAGLDTPGDQFWTQNTEGIKGDAEVGDNFGAALAVGNFDGDDFDDLAIGVPDETIDSAVDAGAVNVIYGSELGLDSPGDQFWTQGTEGLKGVPQFQDRFGTSLATGDFNNDNRDDLAIGVPGESIDGAIAAGAINVMLGTAAGLDTPGDLFLHQGVDGIDGAVEENDQFGFALAAGNFDGDAFTDLAIGLPGDTIGGQFEAGAANVIYGDDLGFDLSRTQLWTQDTPGIKGIPFDNDNFAFALASGDFDGDTRHDLAIGVPGDDVSGGNAANDQGAVNVLYGSAIGFQNLINPVDVNNDGQLSPIDALLIINFLNANPGDSALPDDADPPPFLDVNGDGLVTPIDALLVINELNAPATSAANGFHVGLVAAALDNEGGDRA